MERHNVVAIHRVKVGCAFHRAGAELHLDVFPLQFGGKLDGGAGSVGITGKGGEDNKGREGFRAAMLRKVGRRVLRLEED